MKQPVFTLIICSHSRYFLSSASVILVELPKSARVRHFQWYLCPVFHPSAVLSVSRHNRQIYVEKKLHFAGKIYVWKLSEKSSQAIHAVTAMALRWIIHNPDQTDGCVPCEAIDRFIASVVAVATQRGPDKQKEPFTTLKRRNTHAHMCTGSINE